MIDVLGAIAATAIYAAIAGVLIGFAPVRGSTKLVAFASAAAWGAIIAAAAALGGLAPGTTGPVPATLLPFASLLALLFGSWFLFPRFRNALLSVPLPALIGLNVGRLGGVFFLILAADGRLSAPFAPIAGWGDMIIAAAAIPLAAMAAGGTGDRPALFGVWNLLGAFDLVVAVSLGVLSAPGTPFRVFTEGPGTQAMTTLPWAFVPAMIVPLFLLIHFTIATKLRSLPRTTQAIAVARREGAT